MKNLLKNACDVLKINITDGQVEQFLTYKDILLEQNKVMNLTTITDDTDIILKHFVDSITPCIYRDFSNKNFIDIGTGAGFPAIPIKIMYKNAKATLLDSLNKRINFLKNVGQKLDLSDITYTHSRAEDSGKDANFREKYDFCISRAVCNFSSLAELSLPFVKIGGELIALKGPRVYEELKVAKKCIKIFGGDIYKTEDIKIPFTDIVHTLVFIKKIKSTPKNYPRKSGIVIKNPII